MDEIECFKRMMAAGDRERLPMEIEHNRATFPEALWRGAVGRRGHVSRAAADAGAADRTAARPISAKRLAANRANARKSTGPRTAAGKARVGRNAVRHGLTAKQCFDPAIGRAIDQIGQMLAPGAEGEEADLSSQQALRLWR